MRLVVPCRRKVDHGAFTVNTAEPSCAQTAAALMDYFRSLQMYMVPVTWELYVPFGVVLAVVVVARVGAPSADSSTL